MPKTRDRVLGTLSFVAALYERRIKTSAVIDRRYRILRVAAGLIVVDFFETLVARRDAFGHVDVESLFHFGCAET